MKKLSQAIVAAAALTAGVAGVQTAHAEVEVAAAVDIANMYLFRGTDLGNGSAVVAGDLSISSGGAYAGIWGSSGDSGYGQEYDLYVGYGGETDAFSYDLAAVAYVYPGDDAVNGEGNTGDWSEAILSLGFSGVDLSLATPLNDAGLGQYTYATLGFGAGDFGLMFGNASGFDDDTADYSHVDLSYAYNDSVAFTFSKIVDMEEDAYDDDLKFVVSYSLPIE